MNACNIEPKIKPADQPLQDYQVGFDNLKLNWLVKFSSNNPIKILSLGKLMISRFFEETERSLVFICIVFSIPISYTSSTMLGKIFSMVSDNF